MSLLVSTPVMLHTGKAMSFRIASGQHRAWCEGLVGGTRSRSCRLRGWSRVGRAFTYPEDGNLDTAPLISLAPASECQAPVVHSSHCRSCGQKIPQKGLRLKPQQLCFLSLLERDENQRNDCFLLL